MGFKTHLAIKDNDGLMITGCGKDGREWKCTDKIKSVTCEKCIERYHSPADPYLCDIEIKNFPKSIARKLSDIARKKGFDRGAYLKSELFKIVEREEINNQNNIS